MPASGDTKAPCLASILELLSEKCATSVWRAKTGVQKTFAGHRGTLETYKTEGYSSMTQDGNRNSMYKHAVNYAVTEVGAKNWLEIGPGGHLCLTKLVAKASPLTVIFGIEVNEEAVLEARRYANSQGLDKQVTVVGGLSTDAEVIQQAKTRQREEGAFEAVLQELLGCFAGSEGAAYVMSRVHKDITTGTSIVQVPSRAATFFCPVLVEDKHLAHMTLPTAAVYYAPNAFALVRKLPIRSAALSSGGTGSEWLKAGLIEWLDFDKPEDLTTVQTHVSTFSSPTPAQINALACWIWVETSRQGAPRRLPKTGYPWRATGAPEVGSGCIALSSREDDEVACASNWRNVLIDLRETLHIPANTEVQVEAWSDLHTVHPTYRFVVHVGGTRQFATTISNFYPTFEL